jgi:hypothetical protein
MSNCILVWLSEYPYYIYIYIYIYTVYMETTRMWKYSRMGEERKVLVEKPEGKRPLGRPRRRWEDGIKMDLMEIGWGLLSGFSWLRIGAGGNLL